uniref:Uncharacterized protein n=1 Tax=Anopheles coluzzii TaxID=1518534 RepID=A0A8W7PYW9_ANOCL
MVVGLVTVVVTGLHGSGSPQAGVVPPAKPLFQDPSRNATSWVGTAGQVKLAQQPVHQAGRWRTLRHAVPIDVDDVDGWLRHLIARKHFVRFDALLLAGSGASDASCLLTTIGRSLDRSGLLLDEGGNERRSLIVAAGGGLGLSHDGRKARGTARGWWRTLGQILLGWWLNRKCHQPVPSLSPRPLKLRSVGF